MRDEIDALYEVNREAIEFIELGSRVRVHSFLRPYVAGLVFNVTRKQFRDPKVRRALNAAINRTEIVRSAYRRRARPAIGPLSPEYWALQGAASSVRHDKELAESLLKHLPLTTVGRKMPARVRFRCLVPTFETQPFERIALLLQKQLYAVGVDAELEPVSVRELIKRLPAGDFDAVLMEFFGATPSWLYLFWHSQQIQAPALPNTGYSAADAELEAVDNARTDEELKQAILDVYSTMAEDPPAIFIAWPEVARAVSNRFEVPVEAGRDIMGANLWRWRPAKQQ